MNSVLYDTVIRVIFWILVSILSIILENKFGIIKWLIRVYHKLRNSGIHVRVNVVYDSNLPFDSLKEYIKDGFRNRYKRLAVHKDNPQSLEFMVEDSFQISIQTNPNNEVSILTNKIKSTMHDVTNDVHNILDALNMVKEKIKETKDVITNFEEKEFSLELYLPYKDPFTKIYPPKNIKIKDYGVELIHENYGSIIKLKADILKIHTKHRHNLEKVIESFV